jgi:hypothetical protein
LADGARLIRPSSSAKPPATPGIRKNRAAAAHLRNQARKSETDTMISAAVEAADIKGKSFIIGRSLVNDKTLSKYDISVEFRCGVCVEFMCVKVTRQ